MFSLVLMDNWIFSQTVPALDVAKNLCVTVITEHVVKGTIMQHYCDRSEDLWDTMKLVS